MNIESVCNNCNQIINQHQLYCSSCGSRQAPIIETSISVHNKSLKYFSIFYILNLIICSAIKSFDIFNDYDLFILADIILILITSVFALLNREKLYPLLNVSSISFVRVFECVFIAILASLIVSFSINNLNYNLFDEQSYFVLSFLNSDNPVLAIVFFVAVVPAIFEELAFRGFLWNNLEGILEKRTILIVISFLFSLIHLSLLSFIWLFPFAVLLGYYRIKYKTIWFGVIIHFFFNLTACYIELVELDFI